MSAVTAYLLPLMFALLFTGIPIVFAIGLCVVFVILIWHGVPMTMIFQQFYQGIDSFTIMAIPLFMVCGEIMGKTGITRDILDFCDIFVGKCDLCSPWNLPIDLSLFLHLRQRAISRRP